MGRRTRWILFLLLVLMVVAFTARRLLRGPTVPNNSYLVLELNGDYAEAPPQDIVGRLLRHRERTLFDVLTMIREAQVDRRVKGMIVEIAALNIGWAKAQDLRDALLDYKKSGKPLLALLQQEISGSNKEYYIASAAERIYLSPDVTAPLTGLAAQYFFLGGVWDKLDIQMTVDKIGEYKSIGDMIGGKEMTPANREMADSLLDSINGQFVSGVAHARGLDPAAVAALIDQAPVSPPEYEAAHLSNGTKYLEDLHDEVGGKQTPLLRMKDYAQVDPQSLGLDRGPKLAVVYATGTITSGESGTSLEGPMMGAKTVSRALEDAADDAAVRAIVLRVDSPGGSALASDLVWRATQEARKKKPVIVSMSDVAGSGGYYIAAGASRIVAEPATLTGSIGVVMVRPNIRRLLTRLGINTVTLSRGKFADIGDITAPLSAEGRTKLIAEMDHVYQNFVERVSTGRKLSAERVNEIGRGRVWTGAQAKENGLVDELGGFATAIQAAKEAAGIASRQEVEITFYPRPKSLLERVSGWLESDAALSLPASWRRALVSLAPPFEAGSVLTMMRESIEVR
jgi:protease-4